jgi:translocation and assembly module TamB
VVTTRLTAAAGRCRRAAPAAAADLDDLSALALQKLSGRLEADLSLDVKDGRQGIALDANGSGIKAASAAIDRLDAKARIADARGKPIVDAALAIDRASLAGEVFSKIRLAAKGSPAGSTVTLDADGRGFGLSGAGQLVPGEPLRLDLSAFEAKRGKKRIALAGPASIALAEGGAEIHNLAVVTDGGRIAVAGRVGETLACRPTRPDGGGGVTGGERIDCVAGHIGLEPANPGAGHLIEFA